MRLFTFNTLIFFFVYVPLTLAVGLIVDAFRVEGADEGRGYEVFLWFVITIQMIVPTFLLFAVIHLSIRMLAGGLHAYLRRAVSVVANGMLLPLLQGLLWTGANFSFTWVVVVILPAFVIGGIVRYPERLTVHS